MLHTMSASSHWSATLAGLLLLSACHLPTFSAKHDLTARRPAAGIRTVSCHSHNGAIEVFANPGAEEVEVEAHLEAYADSQEAADEAVSQLSVGLERHGDELVIAGKVPPDLDTGRAPTFAYKITLPPGLSLRITTHNGSLLADGVAGDVDFETHNGGIHADVSSRKVHLESHNGAIELTLAGEGAVDGDVLSHNGGVEVTMGQRAAVVAADTHNGALTAEGNYELRAAKGGSLCYEFGKEGGQLSVGTHNGHLTLR